MKQVSEKVKAERLAALQALLLAQQHAFDDAQIGTTLPVLLEKPGREDGQIMGRTPYLQPVHVAAPAARIGRLARVRITARTANSLHGEMEAA
jgi:tRNA-2-methylthio-N6-dimethylallyladenosine synthase